MAARNSWPYYRPPPKRMRNRSQNDFAEKWRRRDLGGEESLHVTVSVGVTAYPEVEIEDETELIHLADKALYTAKDSGRNRVVKI